MVVYDFKKEMLEDDTIMYRPIIQVTLLNESNQVVVPALLDTGADTTVIPESLAKVLKLELSEGAKVY